jgi:hypothetical protein
LDVVVVAFGDYPFVLVVDANAEIACGDSFVVVVVVI